MIKNEHCLDTNGTQIGHTYKPKWGWTKWKMGRKCMKNREKKGPKSDFGQNGKWGHKMRVKYTLNDKK